jgi:serine/threonine protein kinase
MSGGSLADAFRRPEAFPIRRAVEIALDAARGLAYLHNRRPSPIIHRDLKPGNLMLSGSPYQTVKQIIFETGVVKLADFGLSKTLPVNKHADFGYLDSKFRMTGETGSYRYMAPEVFRHEPYNSSVDVYSYSMIVYQLFETQPPFSGMDPIGAAKNAAMYDLRPQFVQLNANDSYKREIKELIESCWRPNAELRPSFESVVVSLETILSKIPNTRGSKSNDGACCSLS